MTKHWMVAAILLLGGGLCLLGGCSDDDGSSYGIAAKGTNEMYILTLNLNCYQQANQSAKFDTIAKLIADLDVDLVAFQECAQNKNNTIVYDAIRTGNMALVLTNRLKANHGKDYYFHWDWAHYGFSFYEEGVAVMSRYPLTDTGSTWISTNTATSSLVSRKAVAGKTTLPDLGITVDFISTHLHWRTSYSDTEQNRQVSNVRAFATSRLAGSDLTIVCGDYNSQPTETDPVWGQGYTTMRAGGEYIDTFLAMNPLANNLPEDSAYDTVKGEYPGRIDYIFMRTNAAFEVVFSKIIFTPTLVGTVTDHYGVLTRIRKLP